MLLKLYLQRTYKDPSGFLLCLTDLAEVDALQNAGVFYRLSFVLVHTPHGQGELYYPSRKFMWSPLHAPFVNQPAV